MTHLGKRQGVRLVVIGGDKQCQDEVGKLKSLSQSLRIHDSVSVLGLVNQEELPYFYSAADLSVFPSYYESFGLVVLESLACGIPIIAFNLGPMPDLAINGKTGILVREQTSEGLQNAIEDFLQRIDEIAGYRENCRKEALTRFDLEKQTEKYIKLYEDILAHQS